MALHFNRLLVGPTKLPKKDQTVAFSLKGKSSQQKVRLLILRDLWNVDWQVKVGKKNIQVLPPAEYDKEVVLQAMSVKREEIIQANREWIDKHLPIARKNLALGFDVLNSSIDPVIEVCESAEQLNLFRIFRYYWSSPYSEYVGRRIKILIRDRGLPDRPVIGIAALGSPIIHIPERDEFIGWDKHTRTKNLIYTMDAYVIGALPPYNYLLGGKLISYILASDEIRELYRKKYKDKITLIEGRTANSLVGLFTTSLYGRSSQYNRMKYHDEMLYHEIGKTKGYGTLHLSEETISAMIKMLKEKGISVDHKFGDGPSWVMRVIRAAGDCLGFDSDFLLKHSFKRNIYFVPMAKNYREFLNGHAKRPKYYNRSKADLVNFWRTRWLEGRKTNMDIVMNVADFSPEMFDI